MNAFISRHQLNSNNKNLALFSTICLLLLMVCGCAQFMGSSEGADQSFTEPLIFIQGGTIDDFTSYLLLTTMEHIDMQAVILTNTDTIPEYAMQVQWKMMNVIGDSDRAVGLSEARGWNPFPWVYRDDVIDHYKIDAFQDTQDNSEWPPHPPGDSLLYDLLLDAVEKDEPVTLLVTCPLTTLSDLLEEHPGLEDGIERLIWMGGAVHVDGNLDSSTIPAEVAHQKAEWNAFWDPYAVDWIFKNTSFPIVFFPLDVTDQAPVTKEFMEQLKSQASEYRYSDLVHQGYGLVGDEPYFEMWNTLTTVYAAHPEYFDQPVTMNLVVDTEGEYPGAIHEDTKGRKVDVVLNISNKEAFYNYVLEQMQRNSVHESE